MKLTLEHLAPYLPYELKIIGHDIIDDIQELDTLTYTSVNIKGRNTIYGMWADIDDVKPLLLPLDEITDALFQISGYEEEYELIRAIKELRMPYRYMEMLFSNHYDVFGLIDEGLAVHVSIAIN